MKPIKKDELFSHVSEFLKKRGVEMKEGSYSQAIQNGCSFLTDAINLSQQGMERAKTEFDRHLDHMRRVIHEKTAPKTKPGAESKARKPKARVNRSGRKGGKGKTGRGKK